VARRRLVARLGRRLQSTSMAFRAGGRNREGGRDWRRTEGARVPWVAGTAYKGEGDELREQGTAARALSVSVRREEDEDGGRKEENGVRRRTGTGFLGRPSGGGGRWGAGQRGETAHSSLSSIFFLLEHFSFYCFQS
jgi:hypothetical protein